MGLLAERGLSVPDDVSVVGYDDIEGAAHYHPPLTTIKQPLMQAGINLVECLEIIMAGGMPDSRICPTELVVRASSVPSQAAARTTSA
jgi:DNA-binding LacI/PurR family transcriptional regulator